MREKNKMNEEVVLNIKKIELPKLDLDQYIGRKAKIRAVTSHEGKHGFYLKVETGVIDTIGQDTELKASKVFGLYKDAEGQIGWSEDTKLGVYLKKMNANHPDDLISREVIIQKTTNKEGVDFLTF